MKLFVGGLPFDMDDQELQAVFADYGTVSSAKVIMDRDTGKSRGFGFVEFAAEGEAREAMKSLNGAMLEGRAITVKPAEDKPRGGGGGGGFRDGGKRPGGGFNRRG